MQQADERTTATQTLLDQQRATHARELELARGELRAYEHTAATVEYLQRENAALLQEVEELRARMGASSSLASSGNQPLAASAGSKASLASRNTSVDTQREPRERPTMSAVRSRPQVARDKVGSSLFEAAPDATAGDDASVTASSPPPPPPPALPARAPVPTVAALAAARTQPPAPGQPVPITVVDTTEFTPLTGTRSLTLKERPRDSADEPPERDVPLPPTRVASTTTAATEQPQAVAVAVADPVSPPAISAAVAPPAAPKSRVAAMAALFEKR